MQVNPRVLAVCLTANRSAMTKRAVESFKAQSYKNARMLVWDTGEITDDFDSTSTSGGFVVHIQAPAFIHGATIGRLRNEALKFWTEYDIAIHWDSDDYSHPNRIGEQVELLQSSGADCVGYNEVLFWRTPQEEAWIYRSPRMSPAIGSSLCYWRSTWEQRPFADAPKAQGATSEYYEWLRHCKVTAVTGMGLVRPIDPQPRLICSIHGGNTQCYDIEALIAQGSLEWTRAPGFDSYARKVMAL